MEGISYASKILTRAVTLDRDKRYTESLVCYQEGIEILLEALKTMAEGNPQRVKIRNKADEYMVRAEAVKKIIDKLKEDGNYREQLQIEENATGYSYDKIFSRFLDTTVHKVEVEDPYIRSVHQCDNFLRFVELCLRLCSSLQEIKLITKRDDGGKHSEQKARLESISHSVQNLSDRNVKVQLEFSDVLHDREIRLDNGWIIKIGRGLDYFKSLDRHRVGFSDYYFRPCRATTIDIFHKKELK